VTAIGDEHPSTGWSEGERAQVVAGVHRHAQRIVAGVGDAARVDRAILGDDDPTAGVCEREGGDTPGSEYAQLLVGFVRDAAIDGGESHRMGPVSGRSRCGCGCFKIEGFVAHRHLDTDLHMIPDIDLVIVGMQSKPMQQS